MFAAFVYKMRGAKDRSRKNRKDCSIEQTRLCLIESKSLPGKNRSHVGQR